MVVAAVERKLMILSEAAIRLGEDAERYCPGQPWRDIRGTGGWPIQAAFCLSGVHLRRLDVPHSSKA
jgi:uncharacterized protein with HEPN domain